MKTDLEDDAAYLEDDGQVVMADGGIEEELTDDEPGRLRKAGSVLRDGARSATDNKYAAGLLTLVGGAATLQSVRNAAHAWEDELPTNANEFTDAAGKSLNYAGDAFQETGDLAVDVIEIGGPFALAAATLYAGKRTAEKIYGENGEDYASEEDPQDERL